MPRKKAASDTAKSSETTDESMNDETGTEEEEEDDDKDNGKIHCANCRHCILLRKTTGTEKANYLLRVKCEKEMWKKKLGEEKLYKYFTVARRTVEKCDEYEEMGELKLYLRMLRKCLPVRDEIYAVKR